ncbi:uncharacterized protein LOC124264533 [Haliotis rubra]|uniref:uncharacterized protein LOC124264533 n=1 Tax=Haliotis rubra TaxID=36100 RepID=UPI001EE5B10E|nr:uncharacterized protein LOC124264533 [Haliotis rubra]
MMEVLYKDTPLRYQPLKLGDCPHGVPMVKNPVSEDFAESPHLYCVYQREAGRDLSSHSRDLEASVKVSVFWGLAEASGSYSQHDTSNRSKNSLTVRSICRIQKGTLSLQPPTALNENRCKKDICRKATYYVNAICIGGEASLTVQMDTEQDSSSASSETEGEVSVFGASCSKAIRSYASSYSGNCTLYAEYYSPFNKEPLVLKRKFTSMSDIEDCVQKVEKMEQELGKFAEKVRKSDITDLHYKYVFASSASPSSGLNMIDSRMKVGIMLKELEGVLEEVGHEPGPRTDELRRFKSNVNAMVERLKTIMYSLDVDMEKVNSLYGKHAPNYYRRELKRLTSG